MTIIMSAWSQARTVFAQTLQSWIPVPLKEFICLCLVCVCVVPCIGRVDPRPRTRTDCVQYQETERSSKAYKRAVEPLIIEMIKIIHGNTHLWNLLKLIILVIVS
jgi:hypothetical protein